MRDHSSPDGDWRLGVAGTRALNWAEAAFKRTRGAKPWPGFSEPGIKNHCIYLVFTMLRLSEEDEALVRATYDEAKRWYEKLVAEKTRR